jgi:hypothetical protein
VDAAAALPTRTSPDRSSPLTTAGGVSPASDVGFPSRESTQPTSEATAVARHRETSNLSDGLSLQQHHAAINRESSVAPAAAPSSVGPSPPQHKPVDIVRSVFQGLAGVNKTLQIVSQFEGSKRPLVLSQIDLVLFIFDFIDGDDTLTAAVQDDPCLVDLLFVFMRSYEVDSNDTPLASDNTRGDGYCEYRATLQAEMRSKDATLTAARLKALDSKMPFSKIAAHIQSYKDVVNFANPQTQMLYQTKLDESLFNAQNFPEELNPRPCWGDASLVRFLKFDFALLQFTGGDNNVHMGSSSSSRRSGKRTWGKLARVPFHYFDKFFLADPKLSISQMRILTSRSNYIGYGYTAGHFYVLENPENDREDLEAAVSDWIQNLIVRVKSDVTVPQVKLLREYAAQLRVNLTNAPPRIQEKIMTSIGFVDIDPATRMPSDNMRDKNKRPLCVDTLFEVGADGKYNKQDIDELLSAVQFCTFILL